MVSKVLLKYLLEFDVDNAITRFYFKRLYDNEKLESISSKCTKEAVFSLNWLGKAYAYSLNDLND